MENNSRIISGIKGYAHEQEVIKRVIRKYDLLPEDEFDRIFNLSFSKTVIQDGKRVRKPRLRRLSGNGICGDSFLLGGMCGHKSKEWWLDLTQCMCALGLILTSTEKGKVVYRLPQ